MSSQVYPLAQKLVEQSAQAPGSAIADELFPEAIRIIDLYHAKGTVSEPAEAIFGSESEAGAAWG